MPGKIAFVDAPPHEGLLESHRQYGNDMRPLRLPAPWDRAQRYQSKIKVLERRLQEREQFSDWAINPEIRSIQKRNIACDIKSYKRRIRNYKTRLRNAQQAPGSPQTAEKQEDSHEHPGSN